jgi:uncharacterized protein (DUF2141 family)
METNMTRTFLIAACGFAALAAGPATAEPTAQAPGHTLTLTVEGVHSGDGQIMASLLKADFAAGKATQVAGTMVKAEKGVVTIRFAGLADGAYAVQLFHDEDGDGKMKTNMFGIPSEGYGFSNRAKANFGPPKFADMKVEVAGADAATAAVMAY